jgi:hypothetical protein
MDNKYKESIVLDLKNRYIGVVSDYCYQFCEKHEYNYNPYFWVGNEIGGIYDAGDTIFVDFDTMRIDIDNNVSKDEFIKWHEYCLRLGMIDIEIPTPKFKDWINGCSRRSEEEIVKMENYKQKIDEWTEKLQQGIDEFKLNNF